MERRLITMATNTDILQQTKKKIILIINSGKLLFQKQVKV